MNRQLLTRIVLRNYKSIAGCDVKPTQLTFLVGPNGAGKSNFLDGLRFVADSLRFSLDHALRDRGGINEVRRRSSGRPTHFGIRLEFALDNAHGHYAFSVGAKPRGGYQVQREECLITGEAVPGSAFFAVDGGAVTRTTLASPPAATSDRLYLVNTSGIASFRLVYDALAGMGFYNLNPEAIKDLQPPDSGDLLKGDGANIASVLSTLSARSPDIKKRIEEYLSKVVPGVSGVEPHRIGPKETLEFRQDMRGAARPWRFLAGNMSDGTLRALGVLVALLQGADDSGGPRRLVGIEEPEIALHPAAAGVLLDALLDASADAQILVTSHSPDLLDNQAVPDNSVLAVVSEHGDTAIGPLDEAGRSALRDHLYTAGELLRMDQLRPDPALSMPDPGQLRLFENSDVDEHADREHR